MVVSLSLAQTINCMCKLHSIVVAALLSGSCAFAATPDGATSQPVDPAARVTSRPATPSGEKDKPSDDHLSGTHHTLSVGGKTLNYTATAGTMSQKDETGKAKADM